LADKIDPHNNTQPLFGTGSSWTMPSKVARELSVILEPESAFARSLQAVASQLQHIYVDNGVRSFCFIGDAKKTGTSVVAANVAAGFALSRQRTILVETNFKSPRAAQMFGLEPDRLGLSDWMMSVNDASAWSSFMQPVYPGLMLMPAGTATKDSEGVMATELRPLILELSRMFDVVICDTAPMSDVAATLAVVSAVERTVVVARAHKTRMNALFDFQKLVRECGGQLGGSVYLDF
jgi:Mrp family chromosome partitioning ATPase